MREILKEPAGIVEARVAHVGKVAWWLSTASAREIEE
jgi:hypothetical protein